MTNLKQLQTIHQTIYYEIKRETSKYNKYMKWHLISYSNDNRMISSEYYKTKKQAYQSIKKESKLPVGDRILITQYKELQ